MATSSTLIPEDVAQFIMNNALLVADKQLFPEVNLYPWRLVVALLAMLVLLYGIIWDRE